MSELNNKESLTYKFKKGDIFTVDIWTFLKEKLYSYSFLKILTTEEIYEIGLLPPSYGLIMVRYENE
jgi:hypothetical protein